MSSVKIQGNAGGTGIVTIAAPNTNTDRTLTLPDEAGTLVTSAGSGVIEDIVYSGSNFAIKYSNGLLITHIQFTESVNNVTSPAGVVAYPVAYITEPYGFSTMQIIAHGDNNYGRALAWKNGNSLINFNYRVAADSSVGGTLAACTFAVTITGFWK